MPSFKDKNLRIDHKLSDTNIILAPDQQDDRIVVILEDTRQISLEAKSIYLNFAFALELRAATVLEHDECGKRFLTVVLQARRYNFLSTFG